MCARTVSWNAATPFFTVHGLAASRLIITRQQQQLGVVVLVPAGGQPSSDRVQRTTM